MSWNRHENQSIDRSRSPSWGRVRTLVAVAVFALGQLAPLAHIAWSDHLPADHLGSAVTADCLLCESAAARTAEAPLASSGDAFVALTGVWNLLQMSEGRRAVEAHLGPNPARGPPVHI